MTHRTLERVRSRAHLDRKNGWIAGVCAGLANTFGVDAALVRVGVVIAGLFFTKIVIAAYLVAWLVLDERVG